MYMKENNKRVIKQKQKEELKEKNTSADIIGPQLQIDTKCEQNYNINQNLIFGNKNRCKYSYFKEALFVSTLKEFSGGELPISQEETVLLFGKQISSSKNRAWLTKIKRASFDKLCFTHARQKHSNYHDQFIDMLNVYQLNIKDMRKTDCISDDTNNINLDENFKKTLQISLLEEFVPQAPGLIAEAINITISKSASLLHFAVSLNNTLIFLAALKIDKNIPKEPTKQNIWYFSRYAKDVMESFESWYGKILNLYNSKSEVNEENSTYQLFDTNDYKSIVSKLKKVKKNDIKSMVKTLQNHSSHELEILCDDDIDTRTLHQKKQQSKNHNSEEAPRVKTELYKVEDELFLLTLREFLPDESITARIKDFFTNHNSRTDYFLNNINQGYYDFDMIITKYINNKGTPAKQGKFNNLLKENNSLNEYTSQQSRQKLKLDLFERYIKKIGNKNNQDISLKKGVEYLFFCLIIAEANATKCDKADHSTKPSASSSIKTAINNSEKSYANIINYFKKISYYIMMLKLLNYLKIQKII